MDTPKAEAGDMFEAAVAGYPRLATGSLQTAARENWITN